MSYIHNSMDQMYSWKTDIRTANQQVLRILWNSMVYFRVRKTPQLGSRLNQLDTFYIFTFHFCNTQFTIILPSMLRFLNLYFLSGLTTKVLYTFIASPHIICVEAVVFC
jgi:hypothetical protein